MSGIVLGFFRGSLLGLTVRNKNIYSLFLRPSAESNEPENKQ